MSTEIAPITIKVEDAALKGRQLDQATALLRERATDWGILVTRVDFTTYTAALSPNVPFGFTRELDLL